MKRLLFGGLVALGLAMTAAPAMADCYFQYNCCHNLTFVRTARNRCWTFNSHVNPLPCISSCGGGGYSSATPYPAPYGYAPYAHAPYAYGAAAVAAVPAATTAPATSTAPSTQPSFRAPQPTPAASNSTGVQQAGYSYYGQVNNAGYGYNAGYNYGASYGAGYGYYSYAQAPNYWY
jgi:hypothetical protein